MAGNVRLNILASQPVNPFIIDGQASCTSNTGVLIDKAVADAEKLSSIATNIVFMRLLLVSHGPPFL